MPLSALLLVGLLAPGAAGPPGAGVGGGTGATEPERATAPAESVRTGARYRVVVHFEDDALANAALETAEAAWVIAAGLHGGRAPEIETPLAIHLYRTVAEYAAVEQRLSAGLLTENLCFADAPTRSAHLVLQPETPDALLASIGLPTLTRHLVAHEAAHLASFALWPAHRAHPAWFAEGFALAVGAQTLVRRGWSRGYEEDPYLARGLVLARDLAERGALPGFERILRDELDGLDRYERYGLWQSLFQFLRGERQLGRSTKLMGAAQAPAAGESPRDALARAAAELFGDREGFAAFDRELAAFLRAQRPRWDETQRALDTAGSGWLQHAFADAAALAWRTEAAGGASYAVGGELEILAGGEGELRLLLGRRPRGHVAIGFRAGYGVHVVACETGADGVVRTQKLARARVETLASGRRSAFRVEVDPGRLRVVLDKQVVLEAEVGDRPLSGPWGLGAEAGTVGTWRRVDLVRR